MKASELKELKKIIHAGAPIGRAERIAAIFTLGAIEIYALSQGVDGGLLVFVSGLIGAVVGYSIKSKPSK